jgi:hypothetical protein
LDAAGIRRGKLLLQRDPLICPHPKPVVTPPLTASEGRTMASLRASDLAAGAGRAAATGEEPPHDTLSSWITIPSANIAARVTISMSNTRPRRMTVPGPATRPRAAILHYKEPRRLARLCHCVADVCLPPWGGEVALGRRTRPCAPPRRCGGPSPAQPRQVGQPVGEHRVVTAPSRMACKDEIARR